MGHGSSQLDDQIKEPSVSYLDVLNVDNDDTVPQQQTTLLQVKSDPDDSSLPKRLRSCADSECSTAAPSEDEGDSEARTPSRDMGTPLEVVTDGEVKDSQAKFPDPLPAQHLHESTYLIFDWDDTLLPTGFVMDAVKILPPKYGTAALSHRGPRRGHARVGGNCKVSKDFPCFEALKKHAALVERLLTAASDIAHVAIVTSASRPWVFESAEQYLPNLDFAGLLKELQIPVYYAHEHQRWGSEVNDDMEPSAACKRNAMGEFLEQASKDTNAAWNIISVGDSQAEKDAVKAVTREYCRSPLFGGESEERPLCKTVKLMTNPSLKHLSEELEALIKELERLACHNGDFDFCIARPDDLGQQADALLGA